MQHQVLVKISYPLHLLILLQTWYPGVTVALRTGGNSNMQIAGHAKFQCRLVTKTPVAPRIFTRLERRLNFWIQLNEFYTILLNQIFPMRIDIKKLRSLPSYPSRLWGYPLGYGTGRLQFFPAKLILGVYTPRPLGGNLHR